jgi:hypothetical protein
VIDPIDRRRIALPARATSTVIGHSVTTRAIIGSVTSLATGIAIHAALDARVSAGVTTGADAGRTIHSAAMTVPMATAAVMTAHTITLAATTVPMAIRAATTVPMAPAAVMTAHTITPADHIRMIDRVIHSAVHSVTINAAHAISGVTNRRIAETRDAAIGRSVTTRAGHAVTMDAISVEATTIAVQAATTITAPAAHSTMIVRHAAILMIALGARSTMIARHAAILMIARRAVTLTITGHNGAITIMIARRAAILMIARRATVRTRPTDLTVTIAATATHGLHVIEMIAHVAPAMIVGLIAARHAKAIDTEVARIKRMSSVRPEAQCGISRGRRTSEKPGHRPTERDRA